MRHRPLRYNRIEIHSAIRGERDGKQLREVALQTPQCLSPDVSATGVGKHWEAVMNKDEVELLRQEIEMLMSERTHLLKVVGAAAVLVSNTDASSLPAGAVEAAEMLSETLNELHEETLKDALESI